MESEEVIIEETAFPEEKYQEYRLRYDVDAEFKALRHRFWGLGPKRRLILLDKLGLCKNGDPQNQREERFLLYVAKDLGLEENLAWEIANQERLIKEENDRAEYLSTKNLQPPPSDRVVSGRVNTREVSTGEIESGKWRR